MGLLDGILDAVGVSTGGIPWGTIANGVMGFMGNESTNESNQQIAQQNNAFNAHQAQLNRDFSADQSETNRRFQAQQAAEQMAVQQYTSGTAYRRAVSDLKEAGLNPMLAYQQGGAQASQGASGSGSAGSGSAASGTVLPRTNSFSAGLQSAAQAASIDQTQAQIEQTKEVTKRTKAETERTYVDSVRVAKESGRLEALTDQIRQEMKLFEDRWARIMLDNTIRKNEATISTATTEYGQTKPGDTSHRYRNSPEVQKAVQDAERLKALASLLNLDIPEAVNRATHQTKYKGYNVDVKPFIDDTGKLINSASTGAKSIVTRGRGH